MVASDSFASFLREQLAPIGHVTLRRMFGKTGVFCDGLMFGMVTEDELYLRVDEHNQADFEEARSSPPLTYDKQGRTIILSFWRAPDQLLDDTDELVAWARRTMAVYKAPQAVEFRTELPRGASGKTAWRELQAQQRQAETR